MTRTRVRIDPADSASLPPGRVTRPVLDASGTAAARRRRAQPPAVRYQRDGRLLLDLRIVDPEGDEALANAVERILGNGW